MTPVERERERERPVERERERERDRDLFGLELLLLGTHFRFTLLRGLFPLWRVSSFKVTKTTGGFFFYFIIFFFGEFRVSR